MARRSLTLAEKLVEDNKIRVEVGALAKIDIVQAEAEAATPPPDAGAGMRRRSRPAELALKRLIVVGHRRSAVGRPDRPDRSAEFHGRGRWTSRRRSGRRSRSGPTWCRRGGRLDSNDITISYLKQPAAAGSSTWWPPTARRGWAARASTAVRLGGAVTATYPGLLQGRARRTSRTGTTRLERRGEPQLPDRHAAPPSIQHARAKLQRRPDPRADEGARAAGGHRGHQRRAPVEQHPEAGRSGDRRARRWPQQRLEAEQSKFEVGMSTNFFVVQAQRDLADAQITELRAQLDYRKSLRGLRAGAGSVQAARRRSRPFGHASSYAITSGGQ